MTFFPLPLRVRGRKGYEVASAAYFDGSSYLEKTLANSSTTTYTLSYWFKRDRADIGSYAISTRSGNAFHGWQLRSDGKISLFDRTSGGTIQCNTVTDAVYRDASGWTHFCAVVNIGSPTLIYINGELASDTGADFSGGQNFTRFNQVFQHHIGAEEGSSNFLQGHLAQFAFIEGQALDPDSFGRFNPDHGEWEAIKITGLDYSGINSFLLDFADAGNLGADASGNGNDWTNAGVVQSTSTPINTYATLNPLATSSVASLSNANLTVTRNTGTVNTTCTFSTMPFTGKVAFAFTGTFSSQGIYPGIATASAASLIGGGNAFTNDTLIWFANQIYVDGALDSSPGAWTSGVQCQLAIDTDTGSVWIHDGTSWLGGGDPVAGTSPTATVTAGESWVVAVAGSNNGTTGDSVTYDFGQNGYTPPEGFLPLSTANLPEPAILDPQQHFSIELWTGDQAQRTISTTNPVDLGIIKERTGSNHWRWVDRVRGAGQEIYSSLINGEAPDPDGVEAFNPGGGNGVQITDAGGSGYNRTGQDYVGYFLTAGGDAVLNNDGTIQSTVSVNQQAGFSIVTYSGNGSGGATVGHGLGRKPSLVIHKELDNDNSWLTYAEPVGAGSYLNLDTTAAAVALSTAFNNTEPTSDVFTLGTLNASNRSGGRMVAYCFASSDICLVGRYTGNGLSDGPFIPLPFKPAFVMVKAINNGSTTNWCIFDNKREGYNPADTLIANAGSADTSDDYIDLLSNGFKIRGTFRDVNASGTSYIYLAIADAATKHARGR